MEEQITGALLDDLYARTAKRLKLVRRAGGRLGGAQASDLVNEALLDTWVGDLPWNFETTSLLDHLRKVIHYRSWQRVDPARRVPHLSLDESEAAAHEAEQALLRASSGDNLPGLLALANEVIDHLQRLAGDDRPVQIILGAWRQGTLDRDEVIAETGLGERAYATARARISYLVLDLPASLRTTFHSIVRSDP